MKRIISILLLALMSLIALTGCGGQTTADNNNGPTTEEIKAFENSTPENDTDTGLRNIKLDKLNANLTDGQEMIIEYFDEDYLSVPDYEFLRRYPNVYENAQITTNGIVKKVISSTNDEYQLVLWLVKTEDQFYYRTFEDVDYNQYLEENAGSYVLITGSPTDAAWFIEGDFLQVYGRYTGITTIDIDGVSYTIPTLTANKAFINDELGATERYDASFVKAIAKEIFGNSIEVRQPVADTDYVADWEWRVKDEKPFYIVELENQSNAKFTKYRFYTSQGCIEDAKTGSDFWLLGTDPNVQRTIEFSADFEHFFLFTYDTNLETLNLDYYDKSLNKIWNREFEETTSAVYDYTKNNIYLVANNNLYIINIATGEDTFAKSFIGQKQDIRKMPDGILSIGASKSDAVIKNDLDGNMVWTANLSEDVYSVNSVQFVDDNIILQVDLMDGLHYIVIDNQTGKIITDAVSLS